MAKVIVSARVDEVDVRLLQDAAAFLKLTKTELLNEIIRQFTRRTKEEWMETIDPRPIWRNGGDHV